MTPVHPAGEVAERLTWLGHATVLLELSGTRLLTDPVLRSRVVHLRRWASEPADPGALDAVLISHGHRDHLDLPTLRRLDPGATVVTAPGAARSLRRLGRAGVELAPGEEIRIGGVAVRAVPAVHDGRRSPIPVAAGAVGFVVEAGRRVYFAGDTEVFPGMADLAENLDAALVPVWGWGPSLGAGHMDPAQAGRGDRPAASPARRAHSLGDVPGARSRATPRPPPARSAVRVPSARGGPARPRRTSPSSRPAPRWSSVPKAGSRIARTRRFRSGDLAE